MSQPYVGEIRIFGGNFPPAGWAFCDGQIVSIAENDTLYNLIGTTYGGDGISTFGLPDMRGRAPVHFGTKNGVTYSIGEPTGVETVTLTTMQMPNHTHPLLAVNVTAEATVPTTATMLANTGPAGTTLPSYGPYNPATQVALTANSTTTAGGNQPHENMQPYLGLNFIISLYGIYPSSN